MYQANIPLYKINFLYQIHNLFKKQEIRKVSIGEAKNWESTKLRKQKIEKVSIGKTRKLETSLDYMSIAKTQVSKDT